MYKDTAWVQVGSNAGIVNYLTNGDFEAGSAAGWSLSSSTIDSVTKVPNQASGSWSAAAGTLSIATSNSSPLNGTYSLNYVSSGATTAGNMLVSDAFTVPREALAKPLTVKFYYEATVNPTNANWSGTSSNSFSVQIYDVTNGVWIQPAGTFGMTQSTLPGYCTATFQTASNSQSYRLAISNANATSGAATVKFDDFSVSLQTAPLGAPVQYLGQLTTTGSWSANTTYTGYYWRVGDRLRAWVKVSTSGAPTSANLTVNLPSGLSWDNSKLAFDNASNAYIGGLVAIRDNSVAGNFVGVINVDNATQTSISLYYTDDAAGGVSPAAITQAAPMTWANNDSVIFQYELPILGWASGVQMSSETDTRVVIANVSGDAASASSGNPIIFPTANFDTHGGYNATTGRYTVPVSGYYKVFGHINSANAAVNVAVYLDAVLVRRGGATDSAGECTFTTTVYANAGQLLDLRPDATLDATAQSNMTIERASGPAVIAATESVNCRYYASATSVSGSLATINWTTKDYDSHNAMSSGTFTVPVSGKYLVSSAIALSGTIILNNTVDMQLQKNGTVISEDLRYAGGALTNFDVSLADTISCNAGDTIRIQVSSNSTAPAIVSSNSRNFISIVRVGN